MTDFLFLGSKITVDGDCSDEIGRKLLRKKKKKTTAYWQESYDKPRHCVEKHSLCANKRPYRQSYGLPSGHVRL